MEGGRSPVQVRFLALCANLSCGKSGNELAYGYCNNYGGVRQLHVICMEGVAQGSQGVCLQTGENI